MQAWPVSLREKHRVTSHSHSIPFRLLFPHSIPLLSLFNIQFTVFNIIIFTFVSSPNHCDRWRLRRLPQEAVNSFNNEFLLVTISIDFPKSSTLISTTELLLSSFFWEKPQRHGRTRTPTAQKGL